LINSHKLPTHKHLIDNLKLEYNLFQLEKQFLVA
jgi:hypothetical protein